MSLLTPDLGLLFWMTISFAIVFVILAKFAFPVITRMVDERKDYIMQSLSKADEANRALENIKQKSEELIEEARKRQYELIKEATSESNKIIEKAKEDAALHSKQKLDESLRLIELQKHKALGDIRLQVAALSVDIAEKILRQQLEKSENHDRLVEQFLEEIEISGAVKN